MPSPRGVLCANIGNTHTTVGLLANGEVRAHWRVATDLRRTADEWGVLLRNLLSETDADPTGVAVCAAVPAVLLEWRRMLAQVFADVPHVVIEPGVRTGVRLLLDNPREVGTDQVMNALAAKERFGGPAIVVDLGTATTFDVVDPSGAYVGGAIAPGIDISLEALGRRGAQLRMVELRRPRNVIATNTIEALQSGLMFGFAAQVDGMVDRMCAELGLDVADVSVVATGGLAPVVLDECRSVTHHEPWLTLHGLASAFARNT